MLGLRSQMWSLRHKHLLTLKTLTTSCLLHFSICSKFIHQCLLFSVLYLSILHVVFSESSGALIPSNHSLRVQILHICVELFALSEMTQTMLKCCQQKQNRQQRRFFLTLASFARFTAIHWSCLLHWYYFCIVHQYINCYHHIKNFQNHLYCWYLWSL